MNESRPRSKPEGKAKNQPRLGQQVVSIDVRNLDSSALDEPRIRDLLELIGNELRRCRGDNLAGPQSAPRAMALGAVADDSTDGTDVAGGGSGGKGPGDVVDNCVLVSVTYEFEVQNEVGRWVRVEHYKCSDGSTYTLRR